MVQVVVEVGVPSFARPGTKDPHVATFRLHGTTGSGELQASLLRVPSDRRVQGVCWYKEGSVLLLSESKDEGGTSVAAGDEEAGAGAASPALALLDLSEVPQHAVQLDAFSSGLELLVVQGADPVPLPDVAHRGRDLDVAPGAFLSTSGPRGLACLSSSNRTIVYDLESDE